MHDESFSFLPLLIVALLAAGVPLLLGRFRRLRLPVVVGEIIAGLIVGRSGFGWVGEDLWLGFLSTLGFSYLMFLSGLEVDFAALIDQMQGLLKGKGHNKDRLFSHPLILALAAFALILAASAGISLLLAETGWIEHPWFIALILATVSLGVVVPVLKERRLLPTPYGQAVLLAATVADFATMLLISLYAALVSRGLTLDILLVLILIGSFLTLFRLVRLLRRRIPEPLVHLDEWLSAHTAQIPVRIAFALGLAFIALAEMLGIEVILGAFLGGAIIALMSPQEGSELREKLDAFGYGFFIPIFFIHVGTQLDLRTLAGSPHAVTLVGVLTAAAFAVKVVPGLIFRLSYGWRESLGAGVLLSAQLSLTVAAAAIGVDLRLFGNLTETAVVVMAAVTCVLAPLFFEQIVPRVAATRRHGVVIVGADEVGLSLAQRLRLHEEPVAVVDVDPDRCHKAKALGVRIVCGDGRRRETLAEAGLDQARALVSVMRDVAKNKDVCRTARQEFQPPAIVAWLENPADGAAFDRMGVRTVIPSLASLQVLENVVRYPDAFHFPSELEQEGERQIREVRLVHRRWDGQSLADAPLPTEVVVLSIRRGNDLVAPRSRAQLRQGDILVLMGPSEALERAEGLCGGS